MRTDLTEVVLVLDRSGSMGSCKDDTIEAYNKFISEQAKEADECRFTLVLFDHMYDMIEPARARIQDVPLLTHETFVPRGGTALLGAIGKTIDELGIRLNWTKEEERPGNVLVVILTDGGENSSGLYEWSRAYTAQTVGDKIKHQEEKYNWHFVFLGADKSAILLAKSLNISSVTSFAAGNDGPKGASGPKGTRCAIAAMNAATKNYRATKGGSKLDFFEGTESLQAGEDLDNQVVKK
jgi:hypothetical protein